MLISSSVSTVPGPSPGPLQSNVASVPNIFLYWTRSICSTCSAVFVYYIQTALHINHKKKVIDATASPSIGSISYVVEWWVHVCNIFSIKKLANSNLMQAYIESLIRFGSTGPNLSETVPSVLWHCWLGHLTRKNPSPIWPIICLVGR